MKVFVYDNVGAASALYIQSSLQNGNAVLSEYKSDIESQQRQLVTSKESHQSPAARKDTSGSIHRLDVKSRSRLVHLKTNARNKEESMRAGCERGGRECTDLPLGPQCNLYISSAHKGETRRSRRL